MTPVYVARTLHARRGTRSASSITITMSTTKLTLLVLTLAAACTNVKPTSSSSVPEMRLVPTDLRQIPMAQDPIGLHGVAGIRNKVLFGDPTKKGLYSLIQVIPAGTTIKPHSHSDDHVGTVLSGTLQYGYGATFNATALKTLPPGSVYTEPAGQNHFARTGAEDVVIQYTGVGPLKTKYVNPDDAPPMQKD